MKLSHYFFFLTLTVFLFSCTPHVVAPQPRGGYDDVWQAQKTQEIFWTLADNPSKTNFDPFFPPHTPEELKLQIIQNAIRLHYETAQENLPSSTTGF